MLFRDYVGWDFVVWFCCFSNFYVCDYCWNQCGFARLILSKSDVDNFLFVFPAGD